MSWNQCLIGQAARRLNHQIDWTAFSVAQHLHKVRVVAHHDLRAGVCYDGKIDKQRAARVSLNVADQ
jgi:hypothetical protein